MPAKILVVDDEKLIRWSLGERLKKEGYDVRFASNGMAALEEMREKSIDLGIFDLRLPDMGGVALLRRAQVELPGLPVIIMTAYSSVDSAVEAMKCGAVDYLTKPFNMDELAIVVRRALDNAAVQRQFDSHVAEEKTRFDLENVIGEHAAIKEVRRLVRRVARSETTAVLLLGESGTGKDMVARAIHYESSRMSRPFMNITCSALPEPLLESELFGHEKGAFTDAHSMKKGLFEFADGGTVYLDEIGDMRATLQARLLRVLEEKTFKRIGGTADIVVDVRVIAATNRNVDEALRTGRFREDLYYRLSTVPISMPPLRERKDDIPLLAHHFLSVYNREFHRTLAPLSDVVLEKLAAYEWPGNVRELRNVIERAALLAADETICPDDVVLGRSSLQVVEPEAPLLLRLPLKGCHLDEVEKDLVRQALERTRGNRTRAAELLGISRDQVRYKLEKFGLDL